MVRRFRNQEEEDDYEAWCCWCDLCRSTSCRCSQYEEEEYVCYEYDEPVAAPAAAPAPAPALLTEKEKKKQEKKEKKQQRREYAKKLKALGFAIFNL